MLTRTSEMAVKAMILVAREGADGPVPPRRLAEAMGGSPSYLAKICGDLAKAGIVRATRGAQGGVELARPASRILLLEIVEACEGILVPDYCLAIGDALGPVCAFHRAMWDVYMATRGALGKWTLEELAARPLPTGALAGNAECRMAFLREALSASRARKAAKGASPRESAKSERDPTPERKPAKGPRPARSTRGGPK